jgi:hypothetical protein
MQPQPSVADTGLAFAKSLVAGDYASAHTMLSESLRRELSAGDLKAHYEQMVSYTKAPPDTIEVGQLVEPSERDGVPNSLGWAFVNIDCVKPTSTDCWLESVGVLVVEEGHRRAIQQIVWGRP